MTTIHKIILLILIFCGTTIPILTAQAEVKFATGNQKYDHLPTFFNAVESKTIIDNLFLNDIFSSKIGETVYIMVIGNEKIEAKIKQITNHNPQSSSVTLFSTTDPSMMYYIASVTLKNGAKKYSGNAKSFSYSDCLIIENDGTNYYWTKKKLSELIQD